MEASSFGFHGMQMGVISTVCLTALESCWRGRSSPSAAFLAMSFLFLESSKISSGAEGVPLLDLILHDAAAVPY